MEYESTFVQGWGCGVSEGFLGVRRNSLLRLGQSEELAAGRLAVVLVGASLTP